MIDHDLYSPRPTLAKIGKRYYWAVYRHKRPDEADDVSVLARWFPIVRLCDGFVDTREAAVEQIAAIFDRDDPGSARTLKRRQEDPALRGKWNRDCLAGRSHYGADDDIRALARNPDKSFSWARAFAAPGFAAKDLYKWYYARKIKPKETGGHVADHGCLWFYCTWPEDPTDWYWKEARITKITRKRVFVRVNDHGDQCSLDREVLERGGSVWSGPSRDYYYTDAGKKAWEDEKAEGAAQWRRERGETILGELREGRDLLGLSNGYTRADVMRAFRQQALQHHPNLGGDPAVFRRLIEAKELALRRAQA